ncbi:MAG: hypothetical protein IKM74_01780 [Bacteroidales bacterium]|nr:hypothetical protein [Bacteroidales bacterium]
MAHLRFQFAKRKSVADFVSENLPNHFLYHCLKAHIDLPDETILEAFNEAYQTCINVLAEPDIETARSASLPSMGGKAPRSSLLHYSFVYYLLSFHEEAAMLRPFLLNVRAMLEAQMPELSCHLIEDADKLSQEFPGTISFDEHPYLPLPQSGNSHADCGYIKIPTLILLAERLPPDDAKLVLDIVSAAVAFDKGDWHTILQMAKEHAFLRSETVLYTSRFHLRDGQTSRFIKILRTIWKLNIFLDERNQYVEKFEDLASSFCCFLNTKQTSTISNLLYEGRQVKEETYLKDFDTMKEKARNYFFKDDDPQNMAGKSTKADAKEYSQGELKM